MHSILSADWVRQNLPARKKNSHKGSYGTLSVVAGSRRYRGAPLLATSAALRAGAGIVRLASIEAVCAAAAAGLPACILEPLKETNEGGIAPGAATQVLAQKHTAILAGPGLGNTPDTAALVIGLLQKAEVPLVLDADALNVLAGHLATGQNSQVRTSSLALLPKLAHTAVLTPHLGEMARLTGQPVGAVAQHQVQAAQNFAQQYHCVLVLKSNVTVVAAPRGQVYINKETGNPGLAKGGAGDVLGGVIAGLVAQGLQPEIAAAAGVWLHAAAGDIAAQKYGLAGLNPADLPLCLCEVWRQLGR